MKNYLFVGFWVAVIATLFVYKSCSDGRLQCGLPTTQDVIEQLKPKPTTHNNTTTTTVVKPNGTTTTVIVDKTVTNAPRQYRLDLGAAMSLDGEKDSTIYDLGFSKQWMDHAWIGVVGYFQDSNLTHYGIRVGVEF